MPLGDTWMYKTKRFENHDAMLKCLIEIRINSEQVASSESGFTYRGY